jgi:hypothetical protein
VNGELAGVRVPVYSCWEAAGHGEPWALAFPLREAAGPPRWVAGLTCGGGSCFGDADRGDRSQRFGVPSCNWVNWFQYTIGSVQPKTHN